jgi:hypothetical protein
MNSECMVEKTTRAPNLIRAAQALFFLNAAIWLALGIWSLARMVNGNPGHAAAAVIIAILMFGNAAAMLLSGIGVGKRQRLFYYFAAVVLAVNIVLTVTDQFGLLDLITLLIDVALAGILIAIMRKYSALTQRLAENTQRSTEKWE